MWPPPEKRLLVWMAFWQKGFNIGQSEVPNQCLRAYTTNWVFNCHPSFCFTLCSYFFFPVTSVYIWNKCFVTSGSRVEMCFSTLVLEGVQIVIPTGMMNITAHRTSSRFENSSLSQFWGFLVEDLILILVYLCVCNYKKLVCVCKFTKVGILKSY